MSTLIKSPAELSAEQRAYLASARYKPTDSFAPREWIVQDLFAMGQMSIWIGPEKSRKSCFALFMAMSIAAGKEWYKFQIPRSRCVVYFSAEDPSDELDLRYKMFFSLFSPEEQKLIGENLILIKGREFFVSRGIDITSANTAFWSAFVENYRADVYFLDALEMFTDGESNNDLRDSLVSLRNFCGDKNGLEVLHHTRKREDRELPNPVRLKKVGPRLWSEKCLGGGAIKRIADTIVCQEYWETREKTGDAPNLGRVLDSETNLAAFGKAIEDVPCLDFRDGEDKFLFDLVTALSPTVRASLDKLKAARGPWESRNAAARATGLSRSQGNLHIRELERKGYLRPTPKGGVSLA